ncbi:MAG: AAA family ATPase [Deltaproteobacteria bacterium]|nr:AAA family ATPase [Deltaproteobacteria bacterium]
MVTAPGSETRAHSHRHQSDHDRRPFFVSVSLFCRPRFPCDFDSQIDKSKDNIVSYACFISACCQWEGLRHFDSSGVSEIVEHGARLVEDQEKLSTRFSDILDVLIESDYWARKDGSELVTGKHVEKARDEKTYRLNLIEERL